MNKNEKSRVIDGLMRFIVGGGVITTVLVAPGMASVLDKPTRAYFKKLDKRQQERELRRMVYYMKQRGLIKPTTEDYMHGLVITKKGLKRLKNVDFQHLAVPPMPKWDNKWRIILFDIPESHRTERRHLITKLKQIGFTQLQRSVWVYPFPCRPEVEMISHHYGVTRYISYIEATGIDNESALKERFKAVLS